MKEQIEKIFPEKSEIPNPINLPFPIHQTKYLINGEILEWNGLSEQVYSPIYIKENETFENFIGSYPLMDKETSLKALVAAKNAYNNGQGEWPSMTIKQRIECIKKFTFLMREQRNEVVKLMMWEIGKSLKDSEKEFDRTIEYINDTIDALKDLDRDSSKLVIKQGIIAQIRRAPLGVVLCMGPFNYPLNETFTTLIPALTMGNTVVFKPPKLGVLLHSPLLNAYKNSFPKGVVNVIYGDGQEVVAPIMESGDINVLAFIGSCKVADILKKQHPQPHKLKSVLGLEAKNPAIILEDCDFDNVVKECITGSLSFNGQRCTALKIIFVHENIKDAFIEKFVEEVEKLVIGMPWDENVFITPLPEPNKSEHLTHYVEDAISKGAKLCNPSGGMKNKSFFFPAILSEVTEEMKIYHEEQFGPIIPIVSFTDIQKPLDYVVNSNYGQQASIFGQDSKDLAILIDTLVNQVCRVNVNAQCQRGPDVFPFTGRKDSAEGTLSVSDALRVFSIRTLVAFKENDSNKKIVTEIIQKQESNFLSTDFIL
ncbi:MAG: NADP-dependent glyceraldehyde-3-phosphate dehydrogenase [Bacteroidales bacterium]|nr:NADP-dependent glyceraldehyde-3-phosphate dehydrogenase [Bacteroidales bacterium]